MRKLLFIILFLSACNGKSGVDGHEFLGKWIMSESSPGYSEKTEKITMEITKKDIFFWVSIKVDGKDFMDEMIDAKGDDKELKESFHKYQLSPDKQTLIPLSGVPEYVMIFNDDSKTIQNGFGWFKKN